MNANESRLERALDELPDGGGPREGWQDCVLARIEVPRERPRRALWPLAVAGSGLVAAAAAVVLFLALRSPGDQTPTAPAAGSAKLDQLEFTIERIEERVDEAYQDLLSAKTGAERIEVEQALKESVLELEAVKRRLDQARRKWPGVHDGKVTVKCEPTDPLCGIE